MRAVIGEGYHPHAKQLAFHRSGARFIVAAAGIRGGKTISATVEFLRRIYQDYQAGKGKEPAGSGRKRQPRLLYWVVAPISGLCVHPHRYILSFCPPALIERAYEDCIWLKPDIFVEFKTADNPHMLVGASVDGMLITEACRVKAEAWRGALRGRLADTDGWAIFESSPLGGRNNWVYQELVAQSGADQWVDSHCWTTADNPHIPREEIEHARATQPEAYFKRDWEASWDSFGGSIYPDFNEQHVVSDAAFRLANGIPGRVDDADIKRLCRRIVAGVDFGFSSPGAIIVVGHLGDNRIVVLDESYAPARPVTGPQGQTTWTSECKRLRDRWGVATFACDPSRPDAIHDLATQGVPAIGAFNDIYLGIRRVAESMVPVNGVPGMYIMDRCRNLVREIRNYQWKPNKEQTGYAEVPAPNQSDHALDALRYGVVELRPYITKSTLIGHQGGGSYGGGMPIG